MLSLNRLYDNLNKYISDCELPLLALARASEVTPSTLYAWKNGVQPPRASNLILLMNALRISPNELFGWEEREIVSNGSDDPRPCIEAETNRICEQAEDA